MSILCSQYDWTLCWWLHFMNLMLLWGFLGSSFNTKHGFQLRNAIEVFVISIILFNRLLLLILLFPSGRILPWLRLLRLFMSRSLTKLRSCSDLLRYFNSLCSSRLCYHAFGSLLLLLLSSKFACLHRVYPCILRIKEGSNNLMIVNLVHLYFVEWAKYHDLLFKGIILGNGSHCRGMMLLEAHYHVTDKRTFTWQESATRF